MNMRAGAFTAEAQRTYMAHRAQSKRVRESHFNNPVLKASARLCVLCAYAVKGFSLQYQP